MQLGSRALVAGKLTQRTWKTEDGSKRTTTEIVASHVAVDLTFAAAEISKNSAENGPSAASSAEEKQSA